jgi:hypothetical protein
MQNERRGEKAMRTEYHTNITRKQAVKLMPWATKIVKVEGGYKGFESISDYETWRKQK